MAYNFEIVHIALLGCSPKNLIQSNFYQLILNVTHCRTTNCGKPFIFTLLDLSAVFITKNYFILIERLHTLISLSKTALDWLCSYLSGRTKSVYSGGSYSDPCSVWRWVPRGIFLLPLGLFFSRLRISFHFYT